MTIASVEHAQLGIVELSESGHVLRWAKQSKLFGGVSLSIPTGWNQKNQGRFTVAKHLCEKSKSSLLVSTVREGAERGIYCAASNNLVYVIENQVRTQGVVDLAWKKESSTWNDSRKKPCCDVCRLLGEPDACTVFWIGVY